MRIKSLIYLSDDCQTPLAFEKTICFLRGRKANDLMAQMREMIADPFCGYRKAFLLRGSVALCGKEYEVICLRTDKDKQARIAANINRTSEAVQRDSEEYVQNCHRFGASCENILDGTAAVEKGRDKRPLFIYHYFDRLDESVNIASVLDELASLGRQVFVGVRPDYPDVYHKDVQMCEVDGE